MKFDSETCSQWAMRTDDGRDEDHPPKERLLTPELLADLRMMADNAPASIHVEHWSRALCAALDHIEEIT